MYNVYKNGLGRISEDVGSSPKSGVGLLKLRIKICHLFYKLNLLEEVNELCLFMTSMKVSKGKVSKVK